MMLYVLSCRLCEFSADATDIRDLGLQLNTHGSVCHGDPVVMLAESASNTTHHAPAADLAEDAVMGDRLPRGVGKESPHFSGDRSSPVASNEYPHVRASVRRCPMVLEI